MTQRQLILKSITRLFFQFSPFTVGNFSHLTVMRATMLSPFTVKYNLEAGVALRGESVRGGEQATKHAGDKNPIWF